MGNEKIYPEERLIKIMELMKNSHTVDVEGLSQLFQVTGATVRADLRELERRGLVKRIHGGAIMPEYIDDRLKVDKDPVYENRLMQNAAEKQAIGIACAKLLAGKDCIILDDGTTTQQVAKNLSDITVITNGLSICNELVARQNTHVICTGGTLMREDLSFYGKTAEDVIGRFNISCAVLGASGLTVNEGLTAPDEQRAELKKRMIERSVEFIVVADHTKLTRVSLVQVCEIGMVDTLVTDCRIPPELVKQFEQQGVTVVIA